MAGRLTAVTAAGIVLSTRGEAERGPVRHLRNGHLRARSTTRDRKERDMRIDYFLKRTVLLVLVIWVAATINFFLPRLSGNDPVREKLLQQALTGGYVQAGMQQ